MIKPTYIPLLLCLSCSPSKVSVDITAQYPSPVTTAGVSYPLGPVYVGAGGWVGPKQVGYYLSVSKSFQPFKENK